MNTLQQIQALVIDGATEGYAMRHEITSWSPGEYWSRVLIHDERCETVHESFAMVRGDGDAVPDYDTLSDRMTLQEQLDALAAFLAEHKQEAVA